MTHSNAFSPSLTVLGLAVLVVSACSPEAFPAVEQVEPRVEVSQDSEPQTVMWADADGEIHEDVYVVDGDNVIVDGDISLGSMDEAFGEHASIERGP